jgi:DNA-binding HxlR family transcriptional regulator
MDPMPKKRAAADIPTPGRPVRASTTGRPIMALLDLLGRRWALRVIWELRDGPLLFRALQERCDGMSSSVLNQRLRELRAAGIVELVEGGYGLTAEGRRLMEVHGALDDWAQRWAKRVDQEARARNPGSVTARPKRSRDGSRSSARGAQT